MRHRTSYRIPNLVIGTRVALAFAAVALLGRAEPEMVVAGVVLTPFVLILDALDGIAARRLGATSRFGAVLDITADRIVEHVFWIFFAVAGQVGLWVPLAIVTRSVLVDTARSLALAHGRTAFGSETLMRSRLSLFLTASRAARNAYGAAKAAAFVLLGTGMLVDTGAWPGAPGAAAHLPAVTDAAVVAAVVMCVARGVPVLWDSRPYLFAPPGAPEEPCPHGTAPAGGEA